MELREINNRVGLVNSRHFVDKSGNKQGDLIEHYHNGRVKFSATYVDNLREGRCFGYYVTGRLHFTYLCMDDDVHGEMREWNQFGTLERVRFFDKGSDVTQKIMDALGLEWMTDLDNIDDEDRMLIKLKFGLPVDMGDYPMGV